MTLGLLEDVLFWLAVAVPSGWASLVRKVAMPAERSVAGSENLFAERSTDMSGGDLQRTDQHQLRHQPGKQEVFQGNTLSNIKCSQIGELHSGYLGRDERDASSDKMLILLSPEQSHRHSRLHSAEQKTSSQNSISQRNGHWSRGSQLPAWTFSPPQAGATVRIPGKVRGP